MTGHRDIPDEVVKRAQMYDHEHFREDRAGQRGGSWGSVPADQVRRLLWGAYGGAVPMRAVDEASGGDGFLCWAWWRTDDKPGHHRCILHGSHEEHECCCGATAESATRTVAHNHQRGTPCGAGCPHDT